MDDSTDRGPWIRRRRLASRCVGACVAAAGLAAPGPAPGRTWLVLPGGGGDAPTISAAVDSTAPGDTISGWNVGSVLIENLRLVGADASGYGYGGSAVVIGHSDVSIRGCILESCEGPAIVENRLELVHTRVRWTGGILFGGTDLLISDCTFEKNSSVAVQIWWQTLWPRPSTTAMIRDNLFLSNGGGPDEYFSVIGFEPLDVPLDLRVENNLFFDNSSSGVGPVGIGVTNGVRVGDLRNFAVSITGNTFVRQRLNSLGIPNSLLSLPPGTRIERNVFTGAPRGLALSDAWETQVVSCNLSWNNEANWMGFPDPTGIDGNLSEPPKYCNVEAGVYTVAENSPCVAENNACGLQIGAYGAGCGPISVTPTSWGRIKATYRR